VIVRRGVGHAELDDGPFEKWRVRQYRPELGEIFGDMEHELKLTDLHRLRGEQWLGVAAIRVGVNCPY